jgi:hypothetical protein
MTGLDYFRYSLFEAVCTTYRYAENSVNVSSFFCKLSSLKYSRLAFNSEIAFAYIDRLYILMKALLSQALLSLDRGLVVTEMAILLVSC